MRPAAGRDPEPGAGLLAVTLSNELGDAVTVNTLVIVRRTSDGCAPPTGNRVETPTVLAPGSTDVVAESRLPSPSASPPDSQTSSITVTVTGTTTTTRKIRTPDFVLTIR